MAREITKANNNDTKIYSMLTNEKAREFANNVENEISTLKNRDNERGSIDKWNEKYEHQQRIKISK